MRLGGASGALVACLLTASSVAAADEPKMDDLESLLAEPIVFATSAPIATTATEAPGITTIITSKDLQRHGIYTLAEAIDFLSLGMASSNLIGTATIGARGVVLPQDGVDHMLLLINGRPEPIAIRHPGGMSLEIIEHIEVTLGPGSVLYGSGAMLGVINIVLKRAEDFPGIRVGVEGDIPTSIRPWVGAGFRFNLFGFKSEITTQVQYYRQWGPLYNYGTENVGNDASGQLTRFTTSPQGTGVWGGTDPQNAYQSGTAIAQFQSGNLQVYGRAVIDEGSNEGYPADFGNPQNYVHSQTVSIGARHRVRLSPIVEIAGRLYGVYAAQQGQEFQSDYGVTENRSPISVKLTARQLANYGDMELQSFFDWWKSGSFVTLFGFEGRINFTRLLNQGATINSNNYKTAVSFPAEALTDGYTYTLSPYAQQTWSIFKWLSLNAGLRMDAPQGFPVTLSPRIALSVTPWKNGTVKVSYSRAFRSPTSLETGQSGWAFAASAVGQTLQKPSLASETVSSAEISFEQKSGTHRWMIGAFQSAWSNLIEQLPDNSGGIGRTIPTFYNIGSISNFGFQGGARGTLFKTKLSYAFNITGAIARSSRAGEVAHPLDEAPRLFGNAKIAYELPTGWPTLAVAGHFEGQRPADNAFTGGFTPTPFAPPQLVLRGTLTGRVPKLQGLGYRVSATYSTARYDPYVVGPITAAQPGFTRPLLLPVDPFRVTLGLSYEF